MDERWKPHANLPDVAERYIDGFNNDTTFARQMVQDIEPAIEANTRERNETGGWNARRTARKAASIPATVYYQWIAEWEREGKLALGDPQFSERANALCLKRVKDGDYSKFRV